MDKILIIDDNSFNRKYLNTCFQQYGLYSFCAADGIEGLSILMENYKDIKTITLDIEMPKLDGYQFAKIVKSDKNLKNIPIIFVTSKSEKRSIIKGLELFAYDYFVKPVDPDLIYYKVRNAVEFYNQHLVLEEINSKISVQNISLESRLKTNNIKLREINSTILNILETANYYNDEDTGNHIQRVAEYSATLAETIGLNEEEIDIIRTYSPLHDIGKVGIPDSILKKKGKLTIKEFDIMKSHVNIGLDIVKYLSLPEIAVNLIKYHHERWDGSGYPQGAKGAEIPIEGRIIAIADVFDALTTKRCYKEAFSYEVSVKIMNEQAGKHFDPELIKIFFEIREKVMEIMYQLKD